MPIEDTPRRENGPAWTIVLVGAFYAIAGIIVARLPGPASNETRVNWRLVAWGLSGVAFAGHIAHEHFRRRSSRTTIAIHASMAVALASLALAAAAIFHSLSSGASHAHTVRLAFSLVVWPILTGLPAFLVALLTASALAKMFRASP